MAWGEAAEWSGRRAQETVPRIVRVNVESGDRVTRVIAGRERALTGTCACAGNIEGGTNRAVRARRKP